MTLTNSGGALIIASEEHLFALGGEGALSGCEAARFVALGPDAPLGPELIRGASVLVLEVDPKSETSLHRLAKLRAEHPRISLIVALRDANVSLVRTLIRQGVADVAQLPFQPETLAAQILDAVSAQTEHEAKSNLAPMIAVVGATGGCGATTVLTHLAHAIDEANTGNRGICVIDLDLQGGDVAAYLGFAPKVTIDELLAAGGRLDADLFRSAVSENRRGLSFIAAPAEIKPIDRVDTDHLLAVLKLARSMFDYVLVDLPPVWNNWSLSVVNTANRIVLVTDPSVTSLRQAKRRMRLFDEVDIPGSRIDVAINRLERKLFRTVGEDAIADVLGVKIAGTLPLDSKAIPAAQDEGRLVFHDDARSRFGSQVEALASGMLQRLRGD